MQTAKPRVFLTRRISPVALDLLAESCDLEIWPEDTPPPREILLDRASSSDGILCMLTDPVDTDVLSAGANSLKVVSTYAVGFDNIDVEQATRQGIPVGHTPGVLTETTADLAFSLLLGAARRVVEGAQMARSGGWKTWSPTALLGRDVHNATLGILGMGRIGRAVARRGAGFDMRVLYCGSGRPAEAEVPGAELVGLDTLLSESDFLSLHVPLNEQTIGLIDGSALEKMKPTSVLINTARGGVVDHGALYDALASGAIGYAALDVTDPEPLPPDHALYTLPNCIIVPHLGSASVATRETMAVMAAENLLAGLNGRRLPNCANPSVYH